MITELGKELRKLRVDKEERMADMAMRLDVSTSFISAMETGKKSPPTGFEELVSNAYDLSQSDRHRLGIAADRSRMAFTIAPSSPLARDTTGLMARRINTLSDVDLESIKRILLNSRKDEK